MAVQGYATIETRQTSVGTMYDLIMDGQKYGLGKFPPKFVNSGDYVTFEVEMNGQYKNVARGSLKKLPKPEGTTAPTAKAATASYAKAQDNRQEIISKQSAANTAIAFVKMAVETGAIKLPAKNAGDTLLAITKEYIGTFYKMATGEEYKALEEDAGDLASAEANDQGWDE